jgi:hypothetical protein
MIAPGQVKCPNCGKRLRKKAGVDEFTAKDIAATSLYVLGIALIPIGIIIAISVLCLIFVK